MQLGKAKIWLLLALPLMLLGTASATPPQVSDITVTPSTGSLATVSCTTPVNTNVTLSNGGVNFTSIDNTTHEFTINLELGDNVFVFYANDEIAPVASYTYVYNVVEGTVLRWDVILYVALGLIGLIVLVGIAQLAGFNRERYFRWRR